MNLIIKGSPALLGTSKCMCVWLGTIEVADPGQSTIKEGGTMNASIRTDSPSDAPSSQASGIGGGSLAAQGLAPRNAAASAAPQRAATGTAPQSAGAGGAASTAKLLIRGVAGDREAAPGGKADYWVTEYSREAGDVSPQDRFRIRWAVKADGGIRELTGRTGDSLTLDIMNEWASKEIVVMACVEGFNEKVSQRTRVGGAGTGTATKTLITGVDGPKEAYPGEIAEYKVVSYNKSAVSNEDKMKARWEVKIKEEQEELIELRERGDKIKIEMKKEWAGKEIIVMPYMNKATEKMSQKTNVTYINVKMVANYIVKEMLNNINSEICKNVQKFNHDFWWGSPLKIIENKKEAYKLWKKTVGAGGVWDHKKYIRNNFGIWACNKKGGNSLKFYFDLWSNIHYGFVGKHAGFLEIELINGAGWAQIGDNDKSLVSWDTWKEYFKNRTVDIGDADILGGFDDPSDQQAIKVGFYLYDKHKYNLAADILIEKLLEIYNNHKPITVKKCEEH